MTKKDAKPVNPMRSMLSGSTEEAPPVVAQTKGRPDKPLYAMTFRIPRQTFYRLEDAAKTRRTSLQQIVAEAVDLWMRKENEGVFYPEGWDKK